MRLNAKIPVTRLQKVCLTLITLLTCISFFIKPMLFTLMLTVHVFYALFVLFKVFLYLFSFYTQKESALMPSGDVPIYTVLLPVFKEANVVDRLLQRIEALVWPRDKLQVLLLVEYNDKVTQHALTGRTMPSYVEVIIIPPSDVQTKPNACQYAIDHHVKGHYTVIYDAEDKPEPLQLVYAHNAFLKGEKNLACLQAKLNFYNREENWLAALFTVDYTTWFDGYIKGLSKLNLPIPLGGTSNHFRTSILKEVGGYDKYNVTEDADLGVALIEAGYTTKYLESTTWEEACHRPAAWIKQRTRWTMGYMITTLVHMRRGHTKMSAVSYACAFLFIAGTPLSNIFVPVCFYLTLAHYFFGMYGELFAGWSGVFAFYVFWAANLSMLVINVVACLQRRYVLHALCVFLVPVYWLMQAAASYFAVYKLFTAPHVWLKTEHGVSKQEVL